MDDLYCCSRGSEASEVISSTILRTGPVALFSRFNSEFILLKTEQDDECNIWKEKWTANKWAPLEYFESFRDRIPGKDYGQSRFAVRAEDVDWNDFNIVISSDVSVPARITREYPSVAWCYYVREIKTPSYAISKEQPIRGQDLHLNHQFRPRRFLRRLPWHEVEFPYHLQYFACFNELFDVPVNDETRRGVFLEHHSGASIERADLVPLERFGPLVSTAFDPPGVVIDNVARPIRRTIDPEYLPYLLGSKYFLKLGGRGTFGTAIVEAIAAGCLALAVTELTGIEFLFNRNTRVLGIADAVEKISRLENDVALYQRVLKRQRGMVNHLCFTRPSRELFRKAEQVTVRKLQKAKKGSQRGKASAGELHFGETKRKT